MANRALLAIVLMLLIVCVADILAFPEKRRALSAASAKTMSAIVTMREISKEYQHDNMDVLTLTIDYPEITLAGNPDAAELINKEIALRVNECVKVADELYPEAIETYDLYYPECGWFPWDVYLGFEITYNAHGLLSLYSDQYTYLGGAHGSTRRSSATWELDRGTRRTLDSFYEPGADYQTLILETMLTRAENYMATDPDIMLLIGYQDSIKKYFNPQSFYLIPYGLVIYYQEYQVGPYVMRFVEFFFPMDLYPLPN